MNFKKKTLAILLATSTAFGSDRTYEEVTPVPYVKLSQPHVMMPLEPYTFVFHAKYTPGIVPPLKDTDSLRVTRTPKFIRWEQPGYCWEGEHITRNGISISIHQTVYEFTTAFFDRGWKPEYIDNSDVGLHLFYNHIRIPSEYEYNLPKKLALYAQEREEARKVAIAYAKLYGDPVNQ
jgi:hypothetical protein